MKMSLNSSRRIPRHFNKSALCLALSSCFASAVFGASFTNDQIQEWGGAEHPAYTVTKQEEYESLIIDIQPYVEWNKYFLTADAGTSFEVSGLTNFKSFSSKVNGKDDIGTYAFFANSSDTTTPASILLQGDIDAIVTHSKDINLPTVGANLFYAKGVGASITLGADGTHSKAWVISKMPDLISAKAGGKINIQSTYNEFVGSVDFILKPEESEDKFDPSVLGQSGSSVTGTFVGTNSYWYGDEHSFMNLAINDFGSFGSLLKSLGARPGMTVSEIAAIVQDKLGATATSNSLIDTILNYKITDALNLTFKDGAEWSYLGQVKDGNALGLSGTTIEKRISSITLEGGVINLSDEYLARRWQAIKQSGTDVSLADVLQVDPNMKHDYVRIGDLKGNNGIFRIDLNGDDKKNSDMIFIESTSKAGTHYIEPYKLETLTNISESNTLIFALAQKEANDIAFSDKANYFGETLFDYEVEIDKKTIDQATLDEYESEGYVKYDNFYADDYLDGTAWFIKHVSLRKSAATIGMSSAGWASYDAAVQMDRHDRRLKDAVFENEDSKTGLWVRMQHGQIGAKGAYSSDINTVYIGAEGQLTDTLRIGASLSYLDGDAELGDNTGSSELERYEGSLYGTFESGAHYIDVVARFGKVNSDFNTSNRVISKSGSFDQKYAALSAEYGYKLSASSGVFIEPQIQAQGAYLGSFETTVQNNMRMKAEQTTSLIGRIGLRFGKAFKTEITAAEIYMRGDVLHQFTDGQNATISDLDANRLGIVWGDTGTWANYGIGGYFNWKDRFGFQFDVEKSSGGEVADTWLLSGRLNYYFY